MIPNTPNDFKIEISSPSSDPPLDPFSITLSLIVTQSPTNSSHSSSIGDTLSNALKVLSEQFEIIRKEINNHRLDVDTCLQNIDDYIITTTVIPNLVSQIETTTTNTNETK